MLPIITLLLGVCLGAGLMFIIRPYDYKLEEEP